MSQAPVAHALTDSELGVYWTEGRPETLPLQPPLEGSQSSDLIVVGGGFTGLWTAIRAKRAAPSLDVVLVEGSTIGHGASGRNGGFCQYSLTHGIANGERRFPSEMARLERVALGNYDDLKGDLARFGIDCDFQEVGSLDVAVQPEHLSVLLDAKRILDRYGIENRLLDVEETRAAVNSPTYLGGLVTTRGEAILDPGKLCFGLATYALDLGVRIFEHTPVERLSRTGREVEVVTTKGRIRSGKVALGTSAFRPLTRGTSTFIAPVWDYVLMTEPLSQDQLASVGWDGRHGVADTGNLFHYYRLTADNRILWGGYDAVYFKNERIDETHQDRPEVYEMLARHFFDTFPQLNGVRFSHRWAGPIDTCTRFSAFFGHAHGGRVSYATGYTGLGVAASRFGATVMLEHLGLLEPAHLDLSMVRRKPVPFPPAPLKGAVISLTQRSILKAERHHGRRDLWLRTLDRLKLGFDS